MKEDYSGLIFCLLLSIFSLLSACSKVNDDLDMIRSFKGEDEYFKANMVSLHFIIETASLEKINSVFTQMIKTNKLPVNAMGCSDGVYTGESPYDAYDYKHVVKIKIKDEKIVSVDYNERNKTCKGKKEDHEYSMKMSVTGTNPLDAYGSMEMQLLDTQDIIAVDAVSGATYSLYLFRYAVIIALIKAKIGNI